MDHHVEQRRRVLIKMLDESGVSGVDVEANTQIPAPNLSQMRKAGGRVVTEKTLRRVADFLKRDPRTGELLVTSKEQPSTEAAELRTIVLAQTQLILDLSRQLKDLTRLVTDRLDDH